MAARVGLKKNWKDSAGLILVSGPFKYARPPTPLSRVTAGGENPLIVPMDELGAGNEEWKTVLVKRSSTTGFYGIAFLRGPGFFVPRDQLPLATPLSLSLLPLPSLFSLFCQH